MTSIERSDYTIANAKATIAMIGADKRVPPSLPWNALFEKSNTPPSPHDFSRLGLQ